MKPEDFAYLKSMIAGTLPQRQSPVGHLPRTGEPGMTTVHSQTNGAVGTLMFRDEEGVQQSLKIDSYSIAPIKPSGRTVFLTEDPIPIHGPTHSFGWEIYLNCRLPKSGKLPRPYDDFVLDFTQTGVAKGTIQNIIAVDPASPTPSYVVEATLFPQPYGPIDRAIDEMIKAANLEEESQE